MVVILTAAILLLQVVFFVQLVLVFFILCNKSVCFADKSQPRGKFNFLKIWLFCPLYLLYFQNSLWEVQSMQIWSSCNYHM